MWQLLTLQIGMTPHTGERSMDGSTKLLLLHIERDSLSAPSGCQRFVPMAGKTIRVLLPMHQWNAEKHDENHPSEKDSG
jgi:hypothetical protein